MNPLKESNVYKQFVQKTMSKTESSKIDPKAYEAEEEIKLRTDLNLKRIEKIIHTKSQQINKRDETYYDVNNVEPEKFSLFVVTKSPELPTSLSDLATEHYDSIFKHLESEEPASETEEGLAITELNITKTPPTTLEYAFTTETLDSFEFAKFPENKHYNELFLPTVNKDIRRDNELFIPINKENGLFLPVINKDDKSERDSNKPDTNKKIRRTEKIKYENELYLPNYNNDQRKENELYKSNFNLEEDKRENGLELPFNYVASERTKKRNIPNSSRERSKDNDIMFHSSNGIDESNNQIYLPVSDNILEKKNDVYRPMGNIANQRKNEWYLPIDFRVKNEHNPHNKNNNRNLKKNEVNLQNQMYYPNVKGSGEELYLPVNNHVNERKTDDIYLPIDKINSKQEVYLPIVTKVDLKNHEYNDRHNEINLQKDFYLPVQKKKSVTLPLNNRRKNEMNLAKGNVFSKGGTTSVLDVIILR